MRLLAQVTQWAALILGLLSILPHLVTEVWWIDLFAHFKVQYLVAGLLLAGITLIFRLRLWLKTLILIICILNAAFIIPYFIPANPDASNGLKIASINLYSGNREAHRMLAFLTDRDPDILGHPPGTAGGKNVFR